MSAATAGQLFGQQPLFGRRIGIIEALEESLPHRNHVACLRCMTQFGAGYQRAGSNVAGGRLLGLP